MAPALANAVKRRGRKEQKICMALQLFFPEYLGGSNSHLGRGYLYMGIDSSSGPVLQQPG